MLHAIKHHAGCVVLTTKYAFYEQTWEDLPILAKRAKIPVCELEWLILHT
ncbi:hypothetical protein SAMN04488101_101574 [Pedobacter nyackensis]|uniref:Uncharacterized protein n=1 Tax=Pedobacter nyackensis TaxID=475255 RepID=A0A1W2AG57_9SPHI|nr:hypothetical protein SAMN04488101_101574 [Pedobacter nyackensis]